MESSGREPVSRALAAAAAMLACAAIMLVAAPSALAAPPANDNFANAETIGPGIPDTAPGTTAEAIRETGEPNHGGNGQGSVWYSWTPSANVEANLDLCDSIADDTDAFAFFSVYTGSSLAALTRVTQAGSPFFPCEVEFSAQLGVTYRIAVDYEGGPVDFELVLRERVGPPNDDFEDREVLPSALPILESGTTVDATREPGEPNIAAPSTFVGRDSVWFEWTPNVSVPLFFSTCSMGPTLAIYTGNAVNGLTKVAGGQNGSCRFKFAPATGTNYKIQVDGFETAFVLDIHVANPPANDNFANATVLGTVPPVSAGSTTVDADGEAFEQFDPGTGLLPFATVWYRWTPASNMTVSVDTCAGNPNTILSVFTGSGPPALQRVVGDDDGCGPEYGGSRATFNAVGGTTYSIVVDAGYRRDLGPHTLSIVRVDPPAGVPQPQVQTPVAPAGPTGKRAAALKKCKKLKRAPARKNCAKKAKKLPV